MPVRIEAIPQAVRDEMRGRSWHSDPRCPGFDDLALLRVPHVGFDEQEHEGELVVATSVAEQAKARRLPRCRFSVIPRHGMRDRTTFSRKVVSTRPPTRAP